MPIVSCSASRCVVVFLSVLTASVAETSGGLIINTTPSWNGTSSIAPFNGGPGHGRAVGQTVLVGSDNILDDFSFFVSVGVAGANTSFKAYVMQWDTDRTTGPILYSSTLRNVTSTSLSQYTFNTGGLTLTQGLDYILFLDAGDSQQPLGFTFGILSGVNPYPTGQYFLSAFNSNFAQLSTTQWDRQGVDTGGSDAAFIATFSSQSAIIPEPSSLILFTLGTVGLGFMGRWKRKMAA